MNRTPQSNTPPDGDFVRYGERLTSSRLDAPVRQRMLAPVLAHFLPGAGFLFIPALIAYAAWVLFCINRDTSGALPKKMQQLGETAASGQPGEGRK